ncbi:hypothetical protein CWB96_00160 [Pseudoalteromonas citrea]|uniref:Uncharacterized protein n=1 Tax=Pseudoalteromonas citrea TaxID=43655 RepID=A0A5S3XX10_9GAMM|nr:hypothetical protein [Pseudoalteromonas citrea]TMP46279.1 hypothetical protein CWB97_02155 [Pseudoalteromonas citrea]TMP63055.1 hypothetical protein CWB96_00160 [Pseudoalteromonas citrea]
MGNRQYEQFKLYVGTHDNTTAKNLLSTLSLVHHDMMISGDMIIEALSKRQACLRLRGMLREHLESYHFSESSISTYTSRLNQLCDLYLQWVALKQEKRKLTLGRKIMHHAMKYWPNCSKGEVQQQISTLANIPVGTLKRWYSHGGVPRMIHAAGLLKLERLFDVAQGTFVQPDSQKVSKAPTYSTQLRKKPPLYCVLTAHVRAQLVTLCAFKINLISPPISAASFELSRREALPLVGAGRWTSTPDGVNNSALTFTRSIERYFRWIVEKQHVPAEQLDLSLLNCVEMLEGYVHHCYESEKFSTLLTLLTPLYGLCEPHTGFLTRFHACKVSWEMLSEEQTESFHELVQWQGQATYLHQQVGAWIRDIKHQKKQKHQIMNNHGRRNIHWLLDNVDTDISLCMEDMRCLINGLVSESDGCNNAANKLLILQISCWLMLSIKVPLRISNWCAMQWLERPPVNKSVQVPSLWRSAAAYHVKVPRSWLKNRRSDEVVMIEATITDHSTIELLDRLGQLRSQLRWPRSSGALFVQCRDSQCQSKGSPYKRTAFAKVIQCWTGKVASKLWPERGGVHGINPHALRHFMATYVLSKTGDYGLAATKLMDSVAVVIKVYGKNDHESNQEKLSKLGL